MCIFVPPAQQSEDERHGDEALDDDEDRDGRGVAVIRADERGLVHVRGHELGGLPGPAVGQQVGDVEAPQPVGDRHDHGGGPHRSDVGEADPGEDLPGVGPVQGGRLLQLARHRQQGRVQDDRVQAQEPPSLRDRDRRQDRADVRQPRPAEPVESDQVQEAVDQPRRVEGVDPLEEQRDRRRRHDRRHEVEDLERLAPAGDGQQQAGDAQPGAHLDDHADDQAL